MGPLSGLAILFCGIFTIYTAMFTYLAVSQSCAASSCALYPKHWYAQDIYGIYASSAIAAVSLVRNLGGFSFPLFTPALYASLGYQWCVQHLVSHETCMPISVVRKGIYSGWIAWTCTRHCAVGPCYVWSLGALPRMF